MLCTIAINTSNTIRRQTGAAEHHSSGLDTNSRYCVFNYSIQLQNHIRYDTRCYFDMRPKADTTQLKLLHGTNK